MQNVGFLMTRLNFWRCYLDKNECLRINFVILAYGLYDESVSKKKEKKKNLNVSKNLRPKRSHTTLVLSMSAHYRYIK